MLIPAFLAACLLAFAGTRTVHREITFPSRGVSVPASIARPALKRSAPVVLIAHGHGGTRDERFGLSVLADALARRGVASIRMDFAGCGESTEPRSNNNLTTMKADMLAAAQYAKAEMNASSIGLFGYSMGGRIVLEMLAEGFDAGAAAMLAPAADTQDLILTAFPNFTAEHDAARASHAPELRWYEDMLRYESPAAAAAAVWDGPALVIFGQDDDVVRPHVCQNVAETLGAQIYDGTGKGHGYGRFREDDELLARITQAAANFFARHLR